MKTFIIVLLIIISLNAQGKDSLVVARVIDGGAVQGTAAGYSKLMFETAILNLRLSPHFTEANSPDFKITKIENGYEVLVNVTKLDKGDGTFSDLEIEISHIAFFTYNIKFNILPGRFYSWTLNPPKKLDDPLLTEKLDIFGSIKKGEFTSADPLLENLAKENQTDQDLTALYLLSKGLNPLSKNDTLNLKYISSFYQKNPSLNEKFDQRLKSLQKELEIDILKEIRKSTENNALRDVIQLSTVFLNYNMQSKGDESDVKQALKNANIKIESIKKGNLLSVEISVNVSPKGMDLYIDGDIPKDLKRSGDKGDSENLTFVYTYKLKNISERLAINWEVKDPKGDYDAISGEANNPNNEWVVDANTKFKKTINGKLKLIIGEKSYTWYYILGTLAAGAAYVALKPKEPEPEKVFEIGAPQNPSSSRGFLINFGYHF